MSKMKSMYTIFAAMALMGGMGMPGPIRSRYSEPKPLPKPDFNPKVSTIPKGHTLESVIVKFTHAGINWTAQFEITWGTPKSRIKRIQTRQNELLEWMNRMNSSELYTPDTEKFWLTGSKL